jgi:predicted metal-dependent phosphoesterase TrpH
LGFSQQRGIDLHVHSTASDGTLTPTEIIATAAASGLGAVAITDHDTVEGARQALHAERPSTLKFLTGIEISAEPPPRWPDAGSIHILGYGIHVEDPTLNQNLERLRQARRNRNPRIIAQLRRLGFDVSVEAVQALAGTSQLGRPHIAGLLLDKGYVSSIDEAFERYLGKNKPAYVDRERIACREAIQLIDACGGLAVLAHPGLLPFPVDRDLEKWIIAMQDMGLQGIEAYYPEHSQGFTEHCRRIARRRGLLVTGGTDYHGALKPETQMGRGRGNFYVPYRIYEELMGRL